jgi:hypothetical protein
MDEQTDQSIFHGARRIMQDLPKVAGAIVSLSGFAYIVGWAYARAYFDVFGASWIRSELPIITLLGYSWWPVIIVLLFAYLGITDLAETENKEMIETSSRFKASRFTLNYGRWAFIVMTLTDLIAGEFGYPRIARTFSLLSVLLIVAMVTAAAELLAFRLSKPSLKIDLPIIYLTYAVIAFGLYFAPTQMGRNAALEDRNVELSSLPVVMLRDDLTAEFRLLLSSGDRFYIFPAKYDTKYPPIKIVTVQAIQTIHKRIKNERTK